MLLTLLSQQPAVALRIVQSTPPWVWAVLLALLVLGASSAVDRWAGLRRIVLMPAAMVVFSVYGLASAWGATLNPAVLIGVWLVAGACTAALALWWRPQPPVGTRYDAAARRFFLPGSLAPLAVMMAIFWTKYLVGVELALQPALAHNTPFALSISALYGGFSGLLVARCSRLLRAARHGAGAHDHAALSGDQPAGAHQPVH